MKRLTAILMSMMMLTAIPALPAGAVKHTFSGDLSSQSECTIGF